VRLYKRKLTHSESVQEPTNGEIKQDPSPISSNDDITATESMENPSTLESLSIHVAKLAQAMRCPNCNSFMRQYHGGIRLCPNCDTLPTE